MKAKLSLRGWIRASTRHSETMQRQALEAVGCTAIYVAGVDTWEDFVGDLRKHETVCVTTFGRLSSHRTDLKLFRRAVHDRKCHIWEVTTGRRSNNADDATEMMADAVAEQTGDARALPHKDAVRNGRKGGKTKGENAIKARTSIIEAKSVWYDASIKGVPAKLAHENMRGWSKSSAFRKLGKSR